MKFLCYLGKVRLFLLVPDISKLLEVFSKSSQVNTELIKNFDKIYINDIGNKMYMPLTNISFKSYFAHVTDL